MAVKGEGKDGQLTGWHGMAWHGIDTFMRVVSHRAGAHPPDRAVGPTYSSIDFSSGLLF